MSKCSDGCFYYCQKLHAVKAPKLGANPFKCTCGACPICKRTFNACLQEGTKLLTREEIQKREEEEKRLQEEENARLERERIRLEQEE